MQKHTFINANFINFLSLSDCDIDVCRCYVYISYCKFQLPLNNIEERFVIIAH